MIVRVRSIGPLAEALGGARLELEVEEASAVGNLLDRLVRARPGTESFLGRPGDRPVAVFRATRRLAERDLLSPGDEIDLVVTVAGG